jgi:uncharacterized membrane protein YqjE
MANETASPPEGQTVTGLVSGIVSDAQELVKQQVALVRAELKADFRRTVQAAALLAAGSLVLVPVVFLLCNMFVYVLHERADLSLWASYGIVGAALAVVGGTLIGIGVARFRSFNPLPDQSADAIKENVRWMTNPK